MLDDNPVLKERLMAFGAFGGIALFAVASVNLLITGGFDFAPSRSADVNHPQQPSAYVRVVDAANYVGDRFRSISWDEPAFIDSAEAATTEDLVGANDGSAETEVASNDDIYQQIASLYETSAPEADASAYQDATADASYADEQDYAIPSDAEADKVANASGSASPW